MNTLIGWFRHAWREWNFFWLLAANEIVARYRTSIRHDDGFYDSIWHRKESEVVAERVRKRMARHREQLEIWIERQKKHICRLGLDPEEGVQYVWTNHPLTCTRGWRQWYFMRTVARSVPVI